MPSEMEQGRQPTELKESDMPNNYSNSAKVFCPYFKEQYRCKIKCEGFAEHQVNTYLTFKTSLDKQNYLNDFCISAGCYLGCPIAIAINESLYMHSLEEENGTDDV